MSRESIENISERPKERFSDIKGCDEAIVEIKEIQ